MKNVARNTVWRFFRLPSRLVLALLVVIPLCDGTAGITQNQIDSQIAKTIKYLRLTQRPDGSYDYSKYLVGPTALAVLALRTARVPVNDPVIQKACAYLARNVSTNTYEEGLVICALEKVDPKRYWVRLSMAAKYLESAQGATGGWGYTNTGGNDESCSQYAVLGLAAAERCGYNVSKTVKKKAKQFFTDTQKPNGGWGYRQGTPATVSMTCAGTGSLSLLGEKLERVLPDCGEYLTSKRLGAGLRFLELNLGDFLSQGAKARYRFYTLYALERTGILLGLKNIGSIDWYRAGCQAILSDNTWAANPVDASFALLFITKNDAPYAITKWSWRGDWNNDHYDVKNWVDHVSKQLDKPLDWQTRSLADGLDDAARSSMIFLNGHKEFKTTKTELKALQTFLENGGIIVAEACCGSKDFIRSFSLIIEKKLYPKRKMKFNRLGESHPMLNTPHKLSPEKAGAWQLGRGCGRKQVYVLTRDISCAFNEDDKKKEAVDFAHALGENILTYALGKRKPGDKFSDYELVASSLVESLTLKSKTGRGEVFKYVNPLGRINYSGEWNTDPGFFTNFKKFAQRYPDCPDFDEEIVIDPETDDLFACAAVWITGHGKPKLSKRAIINLRRYCQNGGFILAEACCSDREFDYGIHNLFKAIFPGKKLQKIPAEDSVYHFPFQLEQLPVAGTPAYQSIYHSQWPALYGIPGNERWLAIYCPADFSCAFEGDLDSDIPGLELKSAAPLVVNIFSTGLSVTINSQKKSSRNDLK